MVGVGGVGWDRLGCRDRLGLVGICWGWFGCLGLALSPRDLFLWFLWAHGSSDPIGYGDLAWRCPDSRDNLVSAMNYINAESVMDIIEHMGCLLSAIFDKSRSLSAFVAAAH